MNVYIPSSGFATQGPAPEGFHVPLKDEISSLITAFTGIFGTTQNHEEDFIRYLHMPREGYISNGGVKSGGGTAGYYAGATARSSSQNYYYGLNIQSNGFGVVDTSFNRSNGAFIRPFKDTPVTPDSSWTALYSNKIYHNSTLGLISLSSDGTNWITIADKNLGATTVYNFGDTASETNCGKFYQWGNNFGFPFTGPTTTSSTQVDASNYGPGNYYSSSTFITRSSAPYDWSSARNDNLRGGTDGNVNITTMKELKNAYIGEVWTPGSNTIAYLPLESNATDIIHNITLTSQGTTNYTTVGGVKSAEFTKSNWLYSQSFSYVPQGDVAKTWSYWMYIKGANTGWAGIVQMGGGNAGECFGTGCYTGTSNIIMTRSYSTSSTYTPTLNKWTNIIVTYSNSTWKLYANGTLQVTWSSTTAPTSGYSLYLGNNINSTYTNSTYYGNLSNVILENRAWTVDEILNYYNNTKSNYGL